MIAVVSLRTQYSNCGDLLINAILVAQLSRRCPTIALSGGVPASYIAEFKDELERLGGSADFVETPAKLLARVARARLHGEQVAMILSPGDNIAARGAGRALLALAVRARAGIVPAQVGASYRDIGWRERLLLAPRHTARGLLTVRDRTSQALLERHRITVPVVPDLAFALPRRRGEDRTLVLSFRAATPAAVEALAARLAPVVAEGRARGLEPICNWQVAADEAVARMLAARLDCPPVGPAGRRPGLDEARAIYAGAAAVCSNRLHALLLGAAGGAVPLALLDPGERKVSAAFAEAGLEGFVATGAADDTRLVALLDRRTEAQHALDAAFVAAASRLEAWFDRFANEN